MIWNLHSKTDRQAISFIYRNMDIKKQQHCGLKNLVTESGNLSTDITAANF